MCSKKLKLLLVLSVLSFLSCFSPSCFTCSAEVTLTDEEADRILNELKESRTDLLTVQKELDSVKSDCEMQRQSYETQLAEAESENKKLSKVATVTGSSSVALLIVTVLLIIF